MCPALPGREPAAREGAICFRGRHSQLPLTGLLFTQGKVCFLELAWDGARMRVSQGRADRRCGEQQLGATGGLSGHFKTLLRGSTGIPECILGSSLSPCSCRKGHLLSDACSPELLSDRRAVEGNVTFCTWPARWFPICDPPLRPRHDCRVGAASNL